MNENQKCETDELISLYLDGQASVRQQTELKRLMQHDLSITERMERLGRQQQILNALPVETAPATLQEDIRSAIERKLILNDFSEPAQGAFATSHLLVRRLATVAAMILLPLGVLGVVVFEIMKPPPAGPVTYVATDRMIAQTETATNPSVAATEIFTQLPFEGTLVLETDQYMAVSDVVKKAILDQGLLSRTVPERMANTINFNITASPKMVAGLIDSLAAIRPQCESITLQIADGSNDRVIEIAEPHTKQLKALVYEDSQDMLRRLASRYASANQKADTVYAENTEQTELGTDGYPQPSIPELAGTDSLVNRTVRLTIKIERNEK